MSFDPGADRDWRFESTEGPVVMHVGGTQLSVDDPRAANETEPPPVTVDLTTEVRWFVDGRLPHDVAAWFTDGGRSGLAEDRRDTYRLDGQADIGVKRRYQRILELKLRTPVADSGFVRPEAHGRLERWQRWSPADGRIYLTDHANWADVDKSVVKRRFDLDGREVPLTEETRPMQGTGCDAEVASVTVDGHTAWTFAFAAFGDEDRHRDLLAAAWGALLAGRRRPGRLQLRHGDSCGYPEWMARRLGDGRGGAGSVSGG